MKGVKCDTHEASRIAHSMHGLEYVKYIACMSEQVLESLSDMCHLDLALEVSSDMWHTHMMHARYLHAT